MKINIVDNRDSEEYYYRLYQRGNVILHDNRTVLVVCDIDGKYILVDIEMGYAITRRYDSAALLADANYDSTDALVQEAEISGEID